jgi:hypothetical protein
VHKHAHWAAAGAALIHKLQYWKSLRGCGWQHQQQQQQQQSINTSCFMQDATDCSQLLHLLTGNTEYMRFQQRAQRQLVHQIAPSMLLMVAATTTSAAAAAAWLGPALHADSGSAPGSRSAAAGCCCLRAATCGQHTGTSQDAACADAGATVASRIAWPVSHLFVDVSLQLCQQSSLCQATCAPQWREYAVHEGSR